MPGSFDYFRARTIAEATAALKQEGAVVLAGGTDLLVNIRGNKLHPRLVVDIKGLPELKGIRETREGGLWIGALTTMKEIAINTLIQERYKALAAAASVMGCYEIRVRATIGGNICNASPGAETGPVLAILNAAVEINGSGGRRILPLEQFLLGPGRTALGQGEVLVGFILPPLPSGSRTAYLRRSRIKGMDLAAVSVAVLAGPPDSEGKREIRVAAGAVLATPARVGTVEEILKQGPLTYERIRQARDRFAEVIAPRAGSLRATPEYKQEMVGQLMEMGLAKLVALEYRLEEVATL